MNVEKRDQYCFMGPKAAASAQYYDTVISHGYSGDTVYLAWDSAHKFGTRMISDNIASFRDGITIGEEALQAAEHIDEEYRKAFSSCEVYGRSKRMKELMQQVYANAEKEFGVGIKLF